MTDDCTSRAAAISGIVDLLEMEWGYEGIREDVERIFAELPSVKPTEPKRGRWIFIDDLVAPDLKCSLCHELAGMDIDAEHTVRSNFCPHCGADMRTKEGEDV